MNVHQSAAARALCLLAVQRAHYRGVTASVSGASSQQIVAGSPESTREKTGEHERTRHPRHPVGNSVRRTSFPNHPNQYAVGTAYLSDSSPIKVPATPPRSRTFSRSAS
jgi:hypothetical protein